jgi:outer membrane lipoprotein-sorting protein
MLVQRAWSALRQSASAPAALAAAVVVLATVTLAGAAAPVVSARADLFEELFRQGQAKNANLKTLTASFVESTTSSLLTKPLVASGTVAVERPSRILLHYTQPDDRTVLIDGDTMTVTWPSRGVHQVKDIGASQKRIQKYFVDTSPKELRSNFTVTASEATDRPNAYLVTMVPKRKQIQEGLSRLDLWVDRTTQLMVAMEMTFPNGDTKLMTFSDVKPNAPVDPSVFSAR